MSKAAKTKYICKQCSVISSKWAGHCGACGTWDSIIEDMGNRSFSKSSGDNSGKIIELTTLKGTNATPIRSKTGMEELDRVLGGGLVAGSAILIGGDPGIGKSTMLLQLAANMAHNKINSLYITGEESIEQVRLRAKRLKVENSPVKLAAATSVNDIIATIKKHTPDVVIIDSIQTMFLDDIPSAPGTVSQVRTCSHELITLAKSSNTTILLVGHVTKEGQIAGPKILEHMVDTVLYFEGDRGHQFRILRSVKNRFGAANEIGVFEMTSIGVKEVSNPSALFVSGKAGEVSGSVVYAGMEGTRPVMIEIQALVAPTQNANPRRAVVGWDSNRLAMILAVLETRADIKLADKEVYLNVAGGLKITEPAADLAVAAAIISALTNIPIQSGGVVFGEIGLSGEIRPVGQTQTRLKEAQKLGFKSAIIPTSDKIQSKNFIYKEIKYITQIKNFLTEK